MKSALFAASLGLLFVFAAPAAHAQSRIVTTPYQCGSYRSSYPCNAQQNSYYQQQNTYYPQNAYQYPYQYYPQYNYPTYTQPAYPCGYSQYSYGCTQAPTIYSVYPNAGTPGTTITIYGSGFSYRNNSVRFGNGVITNLFSNDGKTLSFVIPTTLVDFNRQ